MQNIFSELKALIDYIQTVYTKITDEWMQFGNFKVNLKKKQISDVDVDGTIYKAIVKYIRFLSERYADIVLRCSSICSCEVTARVKTQNSIEYKIQAYKAEKHEFGRVPINKCVNDLFGFRIILSTPLTFDQIYTFIEETYPGKYRCINSSKFGYRATHVYFRIGNQSFPWELQIWNECDAESNLASHKKHKQDYTTWETENKERGTIDG